MFGVDPRSLLADVVAVPCISMDPGKRKQSSLRPAQAHFDINKIIQIYSSETRDQRNNCYVFQNNVYIDGYLETTVTVDHIYEEATRIREEIARLSMRGGYPQGDHPILLRTDWGKALTFWRCS